MEFPTETYKKGLTLLKIDDKILDVNVNWNNFH